MKRALATLIGAALMAAPLNANAAPAEDESAPETKEESVEKTEEAEVEGANEVQGELIEITSWEELIEGMIYTERYFSLKTQQSDFIPEAQKSIKAIMGKRAGKFKNLLESFDKDTKSWGTKLPAGMEAKMEAARQDLDGSIAAAEEEFNRMYPLAKEGVIKDDAKEVFELNFDYGNDANRLNLLYAAVFMITTVTPEDQRPEGWQLSGGGGNLYQMAKADKANGNDGFDGRDFLSDEEPSGLPAVLYSEMYPDGYSGLLTNEDGDIAVGDKYVSQEELDNGDAIIVVGELSDLYTLAALAQEEDPNGGFAGGEFFDADEHESGLPAVLYSEEYPDGYEGNLTNEGGEIKVGDKVVPQGELDNGESIIVVGEMGKSGVDPFQGGRLGISLEGGVILSREFDAASYLAPALTFGWNWKNFALEARLGAFGILAGGDAPHYTVYAPSLERWRGLAGAGVGYDAKMGEHVGVRVMGTGDVLFGGQNQPGGRALLSVGPNFYVGQKKNVLLGIDAKLGWTSLGAPVGTHEDPNNPFDGNVDPNVSGFNLGLGLRAEWGFGNGR